MKLLLIEDDKDMAESISTQLSDDYVVELAFSGEMAEYQLEVSPYDLIILDLNLPDTEGLELCQKIRKNNIATPILVLTGNDNPHKKVSLLDAGSDDYLTKPFNIEELKARIRTLLRRAAPTQLTNIISIADLTIDLNRRYVTRGNTSINLRRKEFFLLEYLARNAGQVITREMILDHVWENDDDPITNIIDVHIKYLRDRIDKPFPQKLIKTVHGMGYKLEP